MLYLILINFQLTAQILSAHEKKVFRVFLTNIEDVIVVGRKKRATSLSDPIKSENYFMLARKKIIKTPRRVKCSFIGLSNKFKLQVNLSTKVIIKYQPQKPADFGV